MTTVKDFQQLFDTINPEIYETLKRAVELGKWADGERLSRDLRANCMQAVIAYEHKHLSPEERSGYVPPKTTKQPFGTDRPKGAIADPDDKPLKWT